MALPVFSKMGALGDKRSSGEAQQKEGLRVTGGVVVTCRGPQGSPVGFGPQWPTVGYLVGSRDIGLSGFQGDKASEGSEMLINCDHKNGEFYFFKMAQLSRPQKSHNLTNFRYALLALTI